MFSPGNWHSQGELSSWYKFHSDNTNTALPCLSSTLWGREIVLLNDWGYWDISYLHSSTCRGCFSHCLLHSGPWQTWQRCQAFCREAEQPRQTALDCSSEGPTTAAFSLRIISPAFRSLVATMYLPTFLLSFTAKGFWQLGLCCDQWDFWQSVLQ